jgi:Ca-activated chloride channel family protein
MGVVLFLFWAFQRQKKMRERFAGELVGEIAHRYRARRQIVKDVLLSVVFLLGVVALARPQWGFEWREIKKEGLDILVAIDASRSMLTNDVQPNRLERTKLAVKDLIKKLRSDRIGLIAFAGEAFLVCPLTVDYNGFLLSLNDLSVETIPRGGTAIGKAIQEAIQIYEKISLPHKALIIVTDGENLEGDPLALAREAQKKGIKIFCVGIGTKEGDLIRIQDSQGSFVFLKDAEGNFVKSRLNESLLKEIASITGGGYVHSSGAQFGLDLIYETELSKMEKREGTSKMEKKFHDRFQIPLGFALVLLVIETMLGTRKEE